MANTYIQCHIHFVFAVKFRAALIHPSWEDELHKYITAIVQSSNHKMIQVNGMPDHIHLLVGLHPEQSPASLVKEIKIATSKFINAKKNSGSKFAWQEGYGAFSYSKSHLPYVIRYIQNQKIHHRKHDFLHEYRVLLSGFQIDFEERYIFKELE